MTRRTVAHRRGSAYLIVLGATVLLTTMAVGGALVLSREIAAQARHIEDAQARLSAQSILELAVMTYSNKPTEREALANGAAVAAAKIGGLRCAVWATAPDGSKVSQDPADALRMTSCAEGTRSSQGFSVELVPSAQKVTSLDAAMHSGGSMILNTATLNGGPAIGSNGNVTSSGSKVMMRTFATGLVSGGAFATASASGQAAKVMPGANAFKSLALRGTAIAYGAIPSGTIERCVIAPGVNPYGLGDAEGVYVIDCGGGNLSIRDCRIVGNLIVLNASSVELSGSVNWTAANTDVPALAVEGNALFQLDAAPLNENSVGVNLNPVGVPFGVRADATSKSVYPNAITGVVYIDGNARVRDWLALGGTLVVTGTTQVDSGTYMLNRDGDLAVPSDLASYTLGARSGTFTRALQQ